jgi:hypothetical protein
LDGIYTAEDEALAEAGGDPTVLSVLLAPNRQSSAMLQTYLTERAARRQERPAQVSGADMSLVGKEAKFDRHDVLAWLGTSYRMSATSSMSADVLGT